MRSFVVLSICTVAVLARPEPPSGYNYSPPSRPSGGYSPPSGGGGGGGGYNYSPAPSGGGGGGGSYSPPSPQYGAPPQQPTIHKHVYVHVPPPEQEEYKPQKPIPVAPAQKHYKIIFIKAPTQATPTAPTIPVQPQNEEKTLVYVLVKKPEEAPEITIPTPAPTQPNKPEVYFIRYKTQKEQGGGGGYPDSGVPQNQYGAPSAPNPPSSEYGAPSGGGSSGGY